MPGPQVIPVQGDEVLPRKVDVVVIGGGIIGTSTALELAERGIKVALCEKGFIGHEQSSRNWGWVRISRRDPREVPLMAEALRIWDTLDQRTRRDTGFTRSGIMFTYEKEAELQNHQEWCNNLQGYQIPYHVLSGDDIAARYPKAQLDIKGAVFTPADGRAEPQKVAPAIAEAAREHGAHILTQCAVRGIETAGGRICSVITERGKIVCDSVVLAGGAWSSLFSSRFGISLPQLKVLNSVLRTKPIEGGPDETIWTRGFAVRKRQDGGYTIASGFANIVDIVPDSFRHAFKFLPAFKQERRALSLRFGKRFFEELAFKRNWKLDEPSPFEQIRVLDPAPSQKIINAAMKVAADAFPAFKQAEIAQKWGGYIDATPDALPVIDSVDSIPGFYIATGFSGHGFGIGPAAGRLMADIITGHTPVVDKFNFRLARFSDGTKLKLLAGI